MSPLRLANFLCLHVYSLRKGLVLFDFFDIHCCESSSDVRESALRRLDAESHARAAHVARDRTADDSLRSQFLLLALSSQ